MKKANGLADASDILYKTNSGMKLIACIQSNLISQRLFSMIPSIALGSLKVKKSTYKNMTSIQTNGNRLSLATFCPILSTLPQDLWLLKSTKRISYSWEAKSSSKIWPTTKDPLIENSVLICIFSDLKQTLLYSWEEWILVLEFNTVNLLQ